MELVGPAWAMKHDGDQRGMAAACQSSLTGGYSAVHQQGMIVGSILTLFGECFGGCRTATTGTRTRLCSAFLVVDRAVRPFDQHSNSCVLLAPVIARTCACSMA